MGGVAGEQDDLTERVYYSQCMWRGGVIPWWCFQCSLTGGNLRVSLGNTQTRHSLHTHKKGMIIESRRQSEMFCFNAMTLSLSLGIHAALTCSQ